MNLTFYATIDADSLPKSRQGDIPAVPVLLPASSFYRRGWRVPLLPDRVTDRAADCGGFVATFKWGGVYPYTLDDYCAWMETWEPSWAACMDYCCEDEITGGKPGIVRQRQQQTTHNAWVAWQYEYDRAWAWVPTVQGWQVDDYSRHAAELRPLVEQMAAYYASIGRAGFRVGIGTLCRRASVEMIRQVVQAVAAELPGVPLHLWGVKLATLQSPVPLPDQVVSVDSAAWHGLFGSDMRAWQGQGMKKIEYCYKTALPAYQRKVTQALTGPKQAALF